MSKELEADSRRQLDAFFTGAGEMQQNFRSKDWSSSRLGSFSSWPQSLKTAIGIMIDSQLPMVVTWGEDRVFLYNDAYIPILGDKHPQAFGEPFQEVWADVWDVAGELVAQVDKGHSFLVEDQEFHTDRNGEDEVFFATFSYSPIRDESNQVAGLFCAVVETTARKKSEDLSRASEMGLIDTLESMSDAFFSVDKDWLVTRVNKRHEIIVQKSREEQIGRNLIDLWFSNPKFEDSAYLRSYRKAMEERVEVRFEDYYEPLKLWTDVRVYPKEDGGLAVFFTDITERKKLEELSADAKLKFEQSVDVSPAILWITEQSGSCTYLSKQWYDYTGQTESEALGFGWLEMTHPDDKERAGKAFIESNAQRTPFYIEYRLLTRTGEYRWAIDAGNPRYDEKGEYLGYAGTVFDIHELKEAERDSKKSKEEAELAREEAERANALKSAFLANMSHEIRTPLGAILGFSSLLMDKALDSAEKDRYLETIVRNGHSLNRIIDDILDLAKVEAGKLDVEVIAFSPYKLLTESIDLFKDKTREKGIYLLLNIDESVPPLIASDPTRLRQILVNLVGNAVKFTESGGIRVSMRAHVVDAKKIKIEIDVKDTGIGLTEDHQGKLFTPFTQADNSTTRKFGGTGLGLALSQRLAGALSGEISIRDCKLGIGCTFNLGFLAETVSSSKNVGIQPVVSRESKSISLAGIRVLIIDDSADNQLLAARILTKHGADIETANDGEEGVTKAVSGAFDVVLMDIQMPKLDGYQAKAELDRQNYKKPVIALTAHAMAEERAKTKASGFAGHLTKPIDRNDLLKMVAFNSQS